MPSLLDSGKIAGASVSIRQLANQCGLTFPLSLLALINAPRCPFPRCNTLHLKVLTAPTANPISTMLASMRQVYATARIQVIVASREDLSGLPTTTFNDLNNLDVPVTGGLACSGAPTADQTALFGYTNNVGTNEIVVYFVSQTNPATSGCAVHPAAQPGAVVTAGASRWTLAHEVGHVLGLNHIAGENTSCPPMTPNCCSTPNFTRLMTGCGTGGITGVPTVDAGERQTMRASNLTLNC